MLPSTTGLLHLEHQAEWKYEIIINQKLTENALLLLTVSQVKKNSLSCIKL